MRLFLVNDVLEVLEQYKRLKTRTTALKGSATRKLKRVGEFSKHEFLNETAFEQSINQFLYSSEFYEQTCFKLHEENFDDVEKELKENQLVLEDDKAHAIEMKSNLMLLF